MAPVVLVCDVLSIGELALVDVVPLVVPVGTVPVDFVSEPVVVLVRTEDVVHLPLVLTLRGGGLWGLLLLFGELGHGRWL